MTPNGESRLDRIEATLDRLSANAERHDKAAERHDRSFDHLFEISRQHAADIDRLVERANQHDKALDRLTGIVERLADQIAHLADHLADHDVAIREAQARYEEELRRGAEVHREVEEKLNALIQIVDETIRRKPRNGDQPKSN